MPPKIQIISILICIFLVAYVFELVRRKHLSEEYSMGWLITGTSMLALSVSEGLLKWVSELVGATLFTSTLFFFGLLCLVVWFCMARVSRRVCEVSVSASLPRGNHG